MKLTEALKLLRNNPDKESGIKRIFLACGFQPLHIETFLKAELIRSNPGKQIKTETGIYGNLAETLEKFSDKCFDAVAVILEWSDLDARLGVRSVSGWKPEIIPEIIQNAEINKNRLLEIISGCSKNNMIIFSPPSLPVPPVFHTPTKKSGIYECKLKSVLSSMLLDLASIKNVKIINMQAIDLHLPLSQRFDIKLELAAGFPYTIEYASYLAELIAGMINQESPKKGIITDLDDTLWHGILGEDGVKGISWNLDNKSHIYALYQQMLLSLAKAGVLIGVATKNNPDLVKEAFLREDIIIPPDMIFPVEAGWGPKSESASKILSAWNINPDSVVFIDDTPLEIEQMRAAYPSMECILFEKHDDKSVWEMICRLRDIFGKSELNEEDKIRLQSIKSTSPFFSPETSSETLEKILKESLPQVDYSFKKPPSDNRAFELINKTNQFNLNGIRFSEPDWNAAITLPDSFLLQISYKDKFGPLGKIAAVYGILRDNKVIIESWVMSCRAFSRRIEYQALNIIYERFKCSEIEFRFLPTDRNQPLQEFAESFLGYKPRDVFSIKKDLFNQKCPALYQMSVEKKD